MPDHSAVPIKINAGGNVCFGDSEGRSWRGWTHRARRGRVRGRLELPGPLLRNSDRRSRVVVVDQELDVAPAATSCPGGTNRSWPTTSRRLQGRELVRGRGRVWSA